MATYEYNLARQASDGTLWDLFEDEVIYDLDEARSDRVLWRQGLADSEGDPVVILRRVKPEPIADWEVYSE